MTKGAFKKQRQKNHPNVFCVVHTFSHSIKKKADGRGPYSYRVMIYKSKNNVNKIYL